MSYSSRLFHVGTLLLGIGFGSLAVSGGCSGSSEPVMTEEAKKAEMKQLEDQAQANDSAAKSAKSASRPRAGQMPP